MKVNGIREKNRRTKKKCSRIMACIKTGVFIGSSENTQPTGDVYVKPLPARLILQPAAKKPVTMIPATRIVMTSLLKFLSSPGPDTKRYMKKNVLPSMRMPVISSRKDKI